MQIKEITISASVRVNNGDYQSTDFFISAKAEGDNGGPIQPGDAEKLQKSVQTALLTTLVRSFRLRGISTTPHMIAKMFGLSEGGNLVNDTNKLVKPFADV